MSEGCRRLNVEDGFDNDITLSREEALQSVADAGVKPYTIAAGVSVHTFGRLGCVGFAEEVRAHALQLGVCIDYIITYGVPSAGTNDAVRLAACTEAMIIDQSMEESPTGTD